MSGYLLYIGTLICIYSIVAQGVNLLLGISGVLNLGIVACAALGAYAVALGEVDFELGFPVCFLLSAFIGALGGGIAGISAGKLTKEYFALGTLSFHFIIVAFLMNWKSVTRGVLGIPGIPDPTLFGRSFSEPEDFLLLVASTAFIIHMCMFLLWKSPFARRLKAQAEFEEALQALGCDTRKIRVNATIIAGALAGITGCFMAYLLRFIDPSSFTLPEMTLILTIVILGKPGNFFGSIAATIFLISLPESLRFIDWLQQYPGILGPMRQFMYATVLFVTVLIMKKKLFNVSRSV